MHKLDRGEHTIAYHLQSRWGACVYSVAVLEPLSGQVTSQIRDRLMERDIGISVAVTRGDRLASFSGAYDLFVVAAF